MLSAVRGAEFHERLRPSDVLRLRDDHAHARWYEGIPLLDMEYLRRHTVFVGGDSGLMIYRARKVRTPEQDVAWIGAWANIT